MIKKETRKSKKDMIKKLQKTLKEAPIRTKFTKKELSEEIDMPESKERIHWDFI